MNVGITQQTRQDKYGSKIDYLEQSCCQYYSQFGLNLIPIPNILKDPKNFIKELKIKMLILSGGGEISPSLPIKKNIPDYIQQSRDLVEKKLIDLAIDRQIKILGICRGAQVLNAYFGGQLIRGLNQKITKSLEHVGTVHKIKIINTSRYKLGTKIAQVNSYHNDGFTSKELAKNLEVLAKSGDGIVEAFYHANLPITAIMWHPERKSPDTIFNQKLLNMIVG
jgi:N5-(cytidine 5'-diphosphoramidyl)-L-glutamine hydrolase